jgi:hypothetical protein
MSNSSRPNWHFDKDQGTVTLTFPTAPPVALVMKTHDVEELIRHLGDFRGQMSPPVALEYDLAAPTIQAIPGPAWYSFAEPMQGQSVFAVRDPRFGWLHYLMPKDHAKKLAVILEAQSNLPDSSPPGKTN